MIVIFYGTSAELIKMYGIIKSTPRDQQILICNAQQNAGLIKVHKQLDINPDYYTARGWKGKDVVNMKQMLGMMLGAHGSFIKQYRSIKKQIKNTDKKLKTKSVVLVHGDTLSTVVGSYLGRSLRLPVGHVEAGLRSGSWKNPFPEELDRRIVSKIARMHFAPNDLAEQNLNSEKVKGEVINTVFNTAKTAIMQSDKFVSDNYKKLNLPKNYCLVLLHRTELLENRDSLESILKTIREYSDHGNKVVFTMHTTTKEKISSYKLDHYLNSNNITIINKQPYFDFMAIVKSADRIITDGGGLQEDSFFLGIPVLVHRARTERQEGIGLNAVLSEMNISTVKEFLKNPPDRKNFQKITKANDPSKIVVDYLQKFNFISK